MTTSTSGRLYRHVTRDDRWRDVGYLPGRLELLRRVATDGDLYLQRISPRNDLWRALFLPGPRAGLQLLRPPTTARQLLSLWRGVLVYGVERPELYGLTVRLWLTRAGELALHRWTRIELGLSPRRRP